MLNCGRLPALYREEVNGVNRIEKILAVVIAVLFLICCGMVIHTAIETKKLEGQLAELNEKIAYQLSANIVLYEDVAEQEGYDISAAAEERQAWLDNPCAETAKAYSERLESLIPLSGAEG